MRNRLAAFAAAHVTDALQQQIESEEFREAGIPGVLFGNVFLTARGYRSLGFSDAQLATAFTELEDDFFATASNFLEGMRAHGDELNDPPPTNWETKFQIELV